MDTSNNKTKEIISDEILSQISGGGKWGLDWSDFDNWDINQRYKCHDLCMQQSGATDCMKECNITRFTEER